jgi:hypothetical protein
VVDRFGWWINPWRSTRSGTLDGCATIKAVARGTSAQAKPAKPPE